MAFLQKTMLALTAVLIATMVYGQDGFVVEPNCLGCLCEAASKCNVTTACHVPYAGAYFCGPFHISWAYWADAGKPIIKDDNADVKGAFERCVSDIYCAAETVRRYMAKFSQDCGGDGRITCEDVARIHKFGAQGCTAPVNVQDPFWAGFQSCALNLGLA